MIRLKPSEITLTPADVDETRRRMERRKAANAPTTLPGRVHGPALPPSFAAHLRRGPVRSRNDSITSLGNVPILRPQRAVHSSVDEPGDVPRRIRKSLTGSGEAVPNEWAGSPLPGDQIPLDPSSATTRLAVPLPGSQMTLRFRPVHRDQDSSLFTSQEETGEDNAPSPSKTHPTPPRLGRGRTDSSETGNDDATSSPYHASTGGQVDGALTLETPMRVRTRSLRQHSSHMPSPLQHVQGISSPSHRRHGLEGGFTGDDPSAGSEQAAIEASSPPRFIRGYWDSHQRYRFVESVPQTEPRPRTAQPFRRGRTMSSSSEPSYQLLRRPDTSDSSVVEDIFGNTLVTEPAFSHGNEDVQNSIGSSNDRYWSPLGSNEMGYGDPIRTASDRHSSGTSTTSQPYSFYELPDSSRHSSSTYSQAEPLAHSQYDGTAPSRQVSREVSRGAYYSIRLPQSRAASGSHLLPPAPSKVPSTFSPDLSELDQHGLSPLPAQPYSRMPSAQHPLLLSTSLVSVIDFVGGDQDATRAVQRDLSSPLELIQERANAYFQSISTRIQAASSQVRAPESRPQPVRDSEEVNDLPRVADRERRTSSSESLRHESGNTAHGRMSAQPRARMNFAPIPVPDHLDHTPLVHVRISQGPRRTVPATREAQRSSENAPVGNSAQESRPMHMPTQRTNLVPRPTRPGSAIAMRGGELSTSPVMARFSMPHVPRPRDMSNRPHMHSPHSLLLSSDDDPSGSDTLAPVPSTTARFAPFIPHTSIHGPRIPARQASRQDLPSNAPQRQPTRRAVTPIPPPLPFSRQSERGLPSTSTTLDSASGMTSRRVQVARAATSRRRVVHEQENSGEREREDMRSESEGVGWRVGTEGRADVMDETPPRMGRYERLLFN